MATLLVNSTLHTVFSNLGLLVGEKHHGEHIDSTYSRSSFNQNVTPIFNLAADSAYQCIVGCFIEHNVNMIGLCWLNKDLWEEQVPQSNA